MFALPGCAVSTESRGGHHKSVMSIVPVNTCLIVYTPRCCPWPQKPCVCLLYYTLCWTHPSATVTQKHAVRDMHVNVKAHINRVKATETHGLSVQETHTSLTHSLLLLMFKHTHFHSLSQQTAYIGNEPNTSLGTHTHTASFVTFTAHLLSLWHACWTL